jgi:hypothetical protein
MTLLYREKYMIDNEAKRYDLRVCDNGKLVHTLYSWTLSIVLSLSKMLTKYNVSEIGSEIGTSSIYWAQLSRFYLRTEIESNLRNVVFCLHFRQGQDDG